MNPRVDLAIVLSVTTAFLYGLSNVLQLLEAERVPEEYALKLGLMTRLFKEPRWWLGTFADVVGFVAQASALALAAVVFVEPILATGVLMAMLIGATMTHRRIEPADWVAAVALVGGLAIFLYEVAPEAGRQIAPPHLWLIAGPVVAVAILGFSLAGLARHGAPRAACFGIAAGISFGVSAILTKEVVHYLGGGVLAWVPHWESYALAVTSIGGVIVAQSALQTGSLAAAVASAEALGPITAAALGLGLLDERFAVRSAVDWVAVGVSVVVMLVAIAELAHSEARVMARETRSGRGVSDPHGFGAA